MTDAAYGPVGQVCVRGRPERDLNFGVRNRQILQYQFVTLFNLLLSKLFGRPLV